MFDDTRTIEQIIPEYEAELRRASQRERRLTDELAHVQGKLEHEKQRGELLWRVASFLYQRSMLMHRNEVLRIMPELSKLN